MTNVDKTVKLSRMSRDQAERIRILARAMALSPETVGELSDVLYRLTENPAPRWSFVMLNPEQMRFVIRSTNRLKRPDITLRIWTVALTYMKRSTGEVTASREQLATDAETTVQEVSRAMGELTKLGALIRERQGPKITYYVNPTVGWNGGEGARQEAARDAPPLRAAR